MRTLGLDLGTKTLGIAISDALGITAQGVDVFKFPTNDFNKALSRVEELVKERNVTTIVLGYPKNMNNSIGERAKMCERFKKKLENKLGLEVILEDERMTSISANNAMINADLSRKKRKQKIDMLAAQIILQAYLDKNRRIL
jgi:putative Holliday junction resolvase